MQYNPTVNHYHTEAALGRILDRDAVQISGFRRSFN